MFFNHRNLWTGIGSLYLDRWSFLFSLWASANSCSSNWAPRKKLCGRRIDVSPENCHVPWKGTHFEKGRWSSNHHLSGATVNFRMIQVGAEQLPELDGFVWIYWISPLFLFSHRINMVDTIKDLWLSKSECFTDFWKDSAAFFFLWFCVTSPFVLRSAPQVRVWDEAKNGNGISRYLRFGNHPKIKSTSWSSIHCLVISNLNPTLGAGGGGSDRSGIASQSTRTAENWSAQWSGNWSAISGESMMSCRWQVGHI